jgi:hypothetical protein
VTRPDHAAEVRRGLADPLALCRGLGLDKGAKRQPRGGLHVRCPVHAERNPSCSVTLGEGRTIRVKCFGCEFTGDALTLIAVVRGLDLKTQFREILRVGAEIAGLHHVLHELQTGEVDADRPAPRALPEAPPEPERTYPPGTELRDLWRDSGACAVDAQASAMLRARGIDPSAVDRAELARCFQPGIARDRIPRWASYRGQTWRDSGHRLLVKVFDADGIWQSVRAWRVGEGESPKRLPPGGHKAAGLVLANRHAVAMLKGEPCTRRVVITEGEPDFIVRALATRGDPVIGIGSGGWHEGFAARVPYGAEVVIRTHRDRAGDGYAMKVLESVRHRAQVYRLTIDDENEAA